MQKFLMLKYVKNVSTSLCLYAGCILLLLLSGCSNTYYFNKTIDSFQPSVNQTFHVYAKNSEGYNPALELRIINALKQIPLSYTKTNYGEYWVYFRYKKSYFLFPMLGIKIIRKRDPNADDFADQVVYNVVVYSYNTNVKKSLSAAVQLISDDLINESYKNSKLIKYTMKDILKNRKKYDSDNVDYKAAYQQGQDKEINYASELFNNGSNSSR